MDVGDPSNFARLTALYGGSLASMRVEIEGQRVTEEETRAAIREAFSRTGTVLDPHGAVAYAAARRVLHRVETPVVALATAHPAKFAEVIREELGFEPELPPAERDWRMRPLQAIDLPDIRTQTVSDLLSSL
jgi:threonine synthase